MSSSLITRKHKMTKRRTFFIHWPNSNCPADYEKIFSKTDVLIFENMPLGFFPKVVTEFVRIAILFAKIKQQKHNFSHIRVLFVIAGSPNVTLHYRLKFKLNKETSFEDILLEMIANTFEYCKGECIEDGTDYGYLAYELFHIQVELKDLE